MIRWMLLLPLLLLPAVARADLFKPVQFRLANGMTAVVIVDHRAPVVTHMVWYKVGALDDPEGKSGLAHYLEHLMFKGTATVGPKEFTKKVAALGGRDNAFTSWDYTGYFQTLPAGDLETVMRLEADRMTGLLIDPAEAKPELKVIEEERRQVVDNDPGSQMGEQIEAVLYAGHPHARPIIGWPAEIAGLTREDAIVFYRRHYAPNNAILVIAGDVDVEAVKALAEKHYGGIAAVDVAPRVIPPIPPQRSARRLTLADPRVTQKSISRFYIAPEGGRFGDGFDEALDVLAAILDARPTGRLQPLMRGDRAVAVGVGAGYRSRGLTPGRFSIEATLKPGTDPAALESGIDAVIADILRDGVTADEVARAKTRLAAEFVYSRDSLYLATRVLGGGLVIGMTVEEIEAEPDRVKAVTVDSVNQAARAILDARRSVTGWLEPKPAS